MSNRVIGLFLAACVSVAALILAGVPDWTKAAPADTRVPPTTTLYPYTPRPRGVVGQTYTVSSLGRLWVDDTGLGAWNRAETNRDAREQERIRQLFENFWIEPGVRVRIVSSGQGQLRHLEVLSGQHAGRRGWTDAYTDAQFDP